MKIIVGGINCNDSQYFHTIEYLIKNEEAGAGRIIYEKIKKSIIKFRDERKEIKNIMLNPSENLSLILYVLIEQGNRICVLDKNLAACRKIFGIKMEVEFKREEKKDDKR